MKLKVKKVSEKKKTHLLWYLAINFCLSSSQFFTFESFLSLWEKIWTFEFIWTLEQLDWWIFKNILQKIRDLEGADLEIYQKRLLLMDLLLLVLQSALQLQHLLLRSPKRHLVLIVPPAYVNQILPELMDLVMKMRDLPAARELNIVGVSLQRCDVELCSCGGVMLSCALAEVWCWGVFLRRKCEKKPSN